MIETRSILGANISAVDAETALAAIEEFIRAREPRIVVTADSQAVVLARRDTELREIINSADLVTPDSVGILWAARRFGCPLPERVSGIDIVQRLCERAEKTGHSVFLLGASPGVAEQAASNLRKRFPNLSVVGTHHGYFKPEESPSVVEKIKKAKPDILFVAMGIPAQEKWISRNLSEMEVPVSMGVGGTFDVLAGRVKRAPQWIQRRNLEWLYRLVSSPRKIRKCAALPVFAFLVLFKGNR